MAHRFGVVCLLVVALAAILDLRDALADAYADASSQVEAIYVGTSAGQVCTVYEGRSHTPAFAVASPSHPAPVINGFGASDGTGNVPVLTIARASLPLSPTVGAPTLSNVTSWSLTRVAGGSSGVVSASSTAATSMHYTEALTADFRPDSAGWTYNLAVENSALANCGHRHATAVIRTVAPPTITALTATAPAAAQGPGVFIQCSTVDWTATPGDPPATWAVTQSGFAIAHLPSARNATPGRGPQRVCTTQRPGQSTTLTWTGTNEAGSASRSVTIAWAGPGG